MANRTDRYQSLLQKIVAEYRDGMADLSVENRNARVLQMNWNLGRYIVEEEQSGHARAAYGTGLIRRLANDLTEELGGGFSRRHIQDLRRFYNEYEIKHTCAKLTWSHYKALMNVNAPELRADLERQAIEEGLSHNALLKLARKVNGVSSEAVVGGGKQEILVSRKGRFGVGKVVESMMDGNRLFYLDCGFYQLAKMPRSRPRHLVADELLQCEVQDGVVARVVRVDCGRGERHCYRAFLQRVVDGDTLVADMHLPFGLVTRQRLRLRGVYAAELTTPAGVVAHNDLEGRMKPGTALKVLTYHRDMYGRFIADVFHENDERFLNAELMCFMKMMNGF